MPTPFRLQMESRRTALWLGFLFRVDGNGKGVQRVGRVTDSKPGSPTYRLRVLQRSGRFLCLGFLICEMEHVVPSSSATGTLGQLKGERGVNGKPVPLHGTL